MNIDVFIIGGGFVGFVVVYCFVECGCCVVIVD